MKSKLTPRITTIVLLLMAGVILTTSDLRCKDSTGRQSLLEFLLQKCVDRPIFGYADQTLFQDKSIGITKLSAGFDGDLFLKSSAGMDFSYSKSFLRTQFGNIGLGYKLYMNNKHESFPFVDFSLLKTEMYSETDASCLFSGLIIGGNINIFDKRTKWYSNNDIEWFNIGFGLGFDLAFFCEDLIISPIIKFDFGLETFKPDTIALSNLDNRYRIMNYQLGGVEAKLRIAFKDLQLDVMTGSHGDRSKGFAVGSTSANLSFNLWKERRANEGQQYFLNAMKIYIIYSQETLESSIAGNKEPKEETSFSITNNVIKFGVSARLGKIDFYK